MRDPSSPPPPARRGGLDGDFATHLGVADRIRAWLVTGPLGRGLAFAIDFAAALRTAARRRR